MKYMEQYKGREGEGREETRAKMLVLTLFAPCKHNMERSKRDGFVSVLQKTSTNVALTHIPYMNKYETTISPFPVCTQ